MNTQLKRETYEQAVRRTVAEMDAEDLAFTCGYYGVSIPTKPSESEMRQALLIEFDGDWEDVCVMNDIDRKEM